MEFRQLVSPGEYLLRAAYCFPLIAIYLPLNIYYLLSNTEYLPIITYYLFLPIYFLLRMCVKLSAAPCATCFLCILRSRHHAIQPEMYRHCFCHASVPHLIEVRRGSCSVHVCSGAAAQGENLWIVPLLIKPSHRASVMFLRSPA